MSDNDTTITITPMPITARQKDSFGVREAWMNGVDPETGGWFHLDCGAGLGNPHLILTVATADGRLRREVVDFRSPLQQWIASMLEHIEDEP